MKFILKWILTIFCLCVLAFFCHQVAIYPTEFNIICTIIATFVTTFYILVVFKEFDIFND